MMLYFKTLLNLDLFCFHNFFINPESLFFHLCVSGKKFSSYFWLMQFLVWDLDFTCYKQGITKSMCGNGRRYSSNTDEHILSLYWNGYCWPPLHAYLHVSYMHTITVFIFIHYLVHHHCFVHSYLYAYIIIIIIIARMHTLTLTVCYLYLCIAARFRSNMKSKNPSSYPHPERLLGDVLLKGSTGPLEDTGFGMESLHFDMLH